MASSDPLGIPSILQHMADALPSHHQGDDSSDLASSYEAIALLVHAYLTALHFRLVGFDEDKTLQCKSLAPRLPSQWNTGFGSLSFVYQHKQSSMRFVFRIDRMGAKVEVRGLAVGDENIHRFQRTVRDVVDSKKLPVRIPMTEGGQEDRSGLAEKLGEVFVSREAIEELISDLKVEIIQKLISKPQVDGRVEDSETYAQLRAQEPQHERPDPLRQDRDEALPRPVFQDPNHPARLPPFRQPVPDFAPPGFEDEYEMNRPPRGPLAMPDRPPLNIGHDDLNPPGLGPHDPLRGSFTGGGLPRPGGFSGMQPTFDDPLFTGQGGWGGPSGEGPQGGYDPQVPPGARWDPVGPGGGPRFPGPGGRGRGGNPFGGGGGFGDII